VASFLIWTLAVWSLGEIIRFLFSKISLCAMLSQ
jgi:hypothetical protein